LKNPYIHDPELPSGTHVRNFVKGLEDKGYKKTTELPPKRGEYAITNVDDWCFNGVPSGAATVLYHDINAPESADKGQTED
jgi:hypothetical protein